MNSSRHLCIVVALLLKLDFTDGCTFGEGCMYPCHCEGSEPCNPEDGSCPSGCDDGDLGEPGDLLTRGPWSGYGCQIGNVAYLKTAEQGPYTWNRYAADRALDGNHAQKVGLGSCAHPHGNLSSICWWQVDLGQNYVISSVNITNRDSHREWLRDTYIYVSSATTIEDVCYYIPSNFGDLDHLQVICAQPIIGRYVRLERAVGSIQSYDMTICEVQVYGYPAQDCLGTHFGIACAMACNCVLDCDSITGRCPGNACQDGWMEDSCQTPFPVNITSVDVLIITNSSLVVQFHSYVTPEHLEQMEYYYLMDWREADGSVWTDESRYVQHSERLDVYEVLVGGLESGAAYYLRLTSYGETPTTVYRGVPVETGPHRTLSQDNASSGMSAASISGIAVSLLLLAGIIVVVVFIKRKAIKERITSTHCHRNTTNNLRGETETGIDNPSVTPHAESMATYETIGDKVFKAEEDEEHYETADHDQGIDDCVRYEKPRMDKVDGPMYENQHQDGNEAHVYVNTPSGRY